MSLENRRIRGFTHPLTRLLDLLHRHQLSLIGVQTRKISP
jgi:hypothetical protein